MLNLLLDERHPSASDRGPAKDTDSDRQPTSCHRLHPAGCQPPPQPSRFRPQQRSHDWGIRSWKAPYWFRLPTVQWILIRRHERQSLWPTCSRGCWAECKPIQRWWIFGIWPTFDTWRAVFSIWPAIVTDSKLCVRWRGRRIRTAVDTWSNIRCLRAAVCTRWRRWFWTTLGPQSACRDWIWPGIYSWAETEPIWDICVWSARSARSARAGRWWLRTTVAARCEAQSLLQRWLSPVGISIWCLRVE